MTGIIFNSATIAELTQHFDVKHGALFQTISLDIALIFQIVSDSVIHFGFNAMRSREQLVFTHDKMNGRIDGIFLNGTKALI